MYEYSTSRFAAVGLAIAALGLFSGTLLAQQAPFVGPNVNMVSGVTLADGDPFLTKQNEPSIAVSSVNPMNLLAGSNDYRLIPLVQSLDLPEDGQGADSWVGLYKSTDGGRTWRSTVVSGCPLNIAQCNSPLSSAIKGLQFASDPTVRSGPYATFFYSFIAGNRGTGANSSIVVQRFFDLNNNVKFSDDPFRADKLNIIDTGTTGQFKDKPWNAADIPGRPWNAGAFCALPTAPMRVPAFNVYVSYSNFVGQDPTNPHPQINVATSTDCGLTFGKPKKVSQSVATNQGTVLTIDPVTGTVYLVWRQFFTAANNSPDAIYFVKSTDGGSSWSAPAPVAANITPFEQETTSTTFRAEAFPTAAVSVANGVSRVHVAWSQRGIGPGGAARIVMATSANGGITWSGPAPVDNNFQNQTVPYAGGPSAPGWAAFNPWNSAGYGHQLQPALTFAAGKLTMVWQDQRLDHTIGVIDCSQAPPIHRISQCTEVRTQRKSNTGAVDDLSKVFTEDITDGTPGLLFRHTLDVFGGQALPADQPVFAATRVSQYLYGSSTQGTSPQDPVRTPKPIRQLRFNVVNIPIFATGTKPFLGDYIDVAAQNMIPTGYPAQPYAWNISPANKTVIHSAFTSNHDVVPPKNGNWASYTPVKVLAADGITLVQNATCAPGQEGTQNQNIYTAPIFEGIDAYAVVNSKYLNSLTPRPFNVVVQNGTTQTVTVSLGIATQPAGGAAGFKVSGNAVSLTSLIVSIPPSSSITRSVWVKSSTPGATVTVNVNSVNPDGSNPVPVTSVVLNPDPSATLTTAIPPPPAGDITNNNQSDVSVKNNDLSNNDLSNNDLSNNDLSNNDLSNNDLSNNDLSNNDLSNAAVTANDLSNNDLSNNDLSNNDLSNNDLSNNDLSNNDLSNNDLSNAGLTDATFTLFNNGTTDVALDAKALMRGQSIPAGYKVQLIIHKTYTTQTAASCSFAKVQQNIPVLNVPNPAITTINDLSNPSIIDSWVDNPSVTNATLPLMPREIARVSFRLVKTGSTPRSQNQDASFEFGSNGVKTVVVTQSSTIVPIPVVIDTLDLPDATAGQSYSFALQASGGLPPIAWSQIGGSLPPGFNSLSSAGVISGTGTQPGLYTFTVKVADSTTPAAKQQTDKQTLTLIVHGLQSVTFPAGPLTYGVPLTLSANTSAGLPITYSVGSGACTVSGNVVTATSGTGSCTVNASQAGDQIYFPMLASQTFTLTKADQAALTLNAGSPLTYNTTETLTTSGGSGGGAVSFSLTSGSCTLVTNQLTANSGTGSCVLGATKAADPNYNQATASATVTLKQANPTVTFTGAPASAPYQGTFTVASTTNASTSPVYTSSGVCSNASMLYTMTSGTGDCTSTVTWATDTNYNGATLSQTTHATKIAQAALTLNAGSPLTYSTTETLTMLGGSGGGAVGFGLTSGSCTLVTNQLTANSGTGSCVLGATKAGDANYNPTTAAATVTLQKATPVFSGLSSSTISAGTASTALGGAIGYTPSGGGSPVFPSGSVLVTLNGVTQPAAISASGTFSTGFATASLPVGTYTITYKYTGDSNFNPAADGASTLKVAGFVSTGSMSAERSHHTATLLADGKVLVAGGYGNTGQPLASGEIYDPVTGAFSPTANNMPNKAAGHTATLLPGGTVLVVGGGNSSSQLFDPVTRLWSSGGGSGQRSFHTAVLLPNGKVLISGGSDNSGKTTNTALLYDPVPGTFAATGNMKVSRDFHTATLLPNGGGKVLVCGGRTSSGSGYAYLSSAEIYDPATGSFTAVASSMTAARFGHTAAIVNGRVLIAGGSNGTAPLASAELYDPAAGTFSPAGSLATARQYFTATAAGASVLATGGLNGAARLQSAEQYQGSAFTTAGNMTAARASHTATLLNDGRVLIVGGQGSAGVSVATAELWINP